MRRLVLIAKPPFIVAALLLTALVAFAETPKLNIKLKNGSELEQKSKDQVERLAAQYDLKRYTITRDIIIEQGVRPHSSPVLTLNGRFVNNDDAALSVYIHEQGHWLLMRNPYQRNRELLDELQRTFPGIPSDFPRGSGDEVGTYYHLAVCALEWRGLEEVIGAERARAVMDFMKNDHYTAIYSVVIENRDRLEGMMKRYGVRW
jgi:hypothetical protein